MFKLNRQSLSKRAVEDRVSRGIREVSENDGVFVRQRVCLSGEKRPTANGQCDNYKCCAADRSPSNGFRGGLRLNLCCRGGTA